MWGNNFNQNRESNFNQNRGGNFNQSNFSQNQLHRPQVNQSPAYQAPVPQTHSVTKNDFDNYVKANDAIMRNMQNNLQNQGSGTLPGNTVNTIEGDLKGINTEAVLHIKDLNSYVFSSEANTRGGTKDHVAPFLVHKADLVVVIEPDPESFFFSGGALKTGRALIDVPQGLTVFDMACEEYSQEVLGFTDTSQWNFPSRIMNPIELPHHLEYAFLEGDNMLRIIAKELDVEGKICSRCQGEIAPVVILLQEFDYVVIDTKGAEKNLRSVHLSPDWKTRSSDLADVCSAMKLFEILSALPQWTPPVVIMVANLSAKKIFDYGFLLAHLYNDGLRSLSRTVTRANVKR
ncbi:hypothetical protein Tco_0681635 [Tanacetum coccineum]|uniref:Uncharacterized protein n=1 Tax=Tanacetum coccineum TaxID=301880 RepID=A0ABQ4XPU2_9ASTR